MLKNVRTIEPEFIEFRRDISPYIINYAKVESNVIPDDVDKLLELANDNNNLPTAKYKNV